MFASSLVDNSTTVSGKVATDAEGVKDPLPGMASKLN